MAKVSIERKENIKASSYSASRKRAISIAKIIGQNIRAHRVRLGMTLTNFAELLDMSYQQVQKFEKGVSLLSAVQAYDVARILEVPLSTLYKGLSEDHDGMKATTVDTERNRIAVVEASKILDAFSKIEDKKMRSVLLQAVEMIPRQRNT